MRKLFDKLYKKSAQSFYEILSDNLKNNKKTFVVTANPETFMISEKNEDVRKMLLDKETVMVPDGIGVLKAGKKIGYNIEERITGIDIANELLKFGNEQKKSIYLFGSKQEVIDSMKIVIKEQYPNLKLVGTSNGYVTDKDKVFDEIVKLEPDIVLVALGIPLQEMLIYKHLNRFKKGIFVGVGGSFDVMSGMKKRAPKIFIKLNLEWLYRIMKEPKRFKRFYNSNVKFLFKVKKKDHKSLVDCIFILFIFIFMIGGLIKTIFGFNNINYYENRVAYKLPKFNITDIVNKSFQDNVELSFSDQMPLSITMKKVYNFSQNFITNLSSDIIFKNNCENKYIKLGESIITYGCEKNLVYYESFVSQSKSAYDDRISNINEVLDNIDVDTYIYYIEKDTDINFSTNQKNDIYEYLKSNINSENVYRYEINSFDDFKERFYKTDHHWNYKGSYLSYVQLVNILTNDTPLPYSDEVCLNDNFTGSKASFGGASHLYKESFCAYKFKFPNYEIYVNGDKSEYGNQEYCFEHPNENMSYGLFYGADSGEIIFKNKDNNSDENILIIGESYDNALLKLLASHFNNTYSIDLRNYERENDKKFDLLNYIDVNDIDKILLIGNRDYFLLKTFDMEV